MNNKNFTIISDGLPSNTVLNLLDLIEMKANNTSNITKHVMGITV